MRRYLRFGSGGPLSSDRSARVAELARYDHPKLAFLQVEVAMLSLLSCGLDPPARLSLGLCTSLPEVPCFLNSLCRAKVVCDAERSWFYTKDSYTTDGRIIRVSKDIYKEGLKLPDPTELAKTMWFLRKQSQWTSAVHNNLWMYKDCIILALHMLLLAPTHAEPDPTGITVHTYYAALAEFTPGQLRAMGIDPASLIDKALAYNSVPFTKDAYKEIGDMPVGWHATPFSHTAVSMAYRTLPWRPLLLETFRRVDKASLPFSRELINRSYYVSIALLNMIVVTRDGSEADILTILRNNTKNDMIIILFVRTREEVMRRYLDLIDAEDFAP